MPRSLLPTTKQRNSSACGTSTHCLRQMCGWMLRERANCRSSATKSLLRINNST